MPAAKSSSGPSSPQRPWIGASLVAGIVAGGIASLILALGYYSRFPCEPPLGSWSMSAASVALVGPISGAALGLSISGGMVLARRRGGRALHELLFAAAGGVIGGLVPCLIGVVGYGSLSAPYIGTDLAALGVLVATTLLGASLSLPAATGRVSEVSPSATLVCSALASTLVIMPFGLVVAGLVAAALPLAALREILYFLGGACHDAPLVLAALSLGIAAIFGALVGTFIGLSCDLASLLRNSWSLVAQRR